jgi:CHAT domain-containing protein
MKKSQLKAIIKECLIELLNEGLGNIAVPSLSMEQKLVNQSTLEEIIAKKHQENFQRKKNMIKEQTQNISATNIPTTKNQVFNNIFQDTANTTLLTQNNPLEPGELPISPSDLFNPDSFLIWDKLAFDKKT